MADVKSTGLAQTVLGTVRPEELGVTMMHEHLFVDLGRIFDEPHDPEEKAMANAPLSLANLAFVTMNLSRNRDNLILSDKDLATSELALFKKAGGGTIVDVTTAEFGRDPVALREMAERSGLHIVMGCGHYHAMFHSPDMDQLNEAAIADGIIHDVQAGVDGTGIRAGIIGEVGCSWPTLPNEAKALRATARAQKATGAPVTIHPGRHVDSPFAILDILERAGADISRVIMGHIERTGLDKDGLLRLARSGCVLEYDWFGEVRPAYPHGRVDVPSDGERIKEIAFLISEGFARSIVVSQDVCFKTRLTAFGGPGYAHVVKYVRRWMSALGIADADFETILIDNPRRILAFA